MTLITRMVHEEKLPTKHTKHPNEAESACKAFVPFVCFVGKTLLHARIAGNRREAGKAAHLKKSQVFLKCAALEA